MNRPFIFGITASGESFTDRKRETERLLANFLHGVNTIVISPRRWGKTSLVKKAGELAMQQNVCVVHIDIFSCRTENDFFEAYATAVVKQTSSRWEEWVENTKNFLSRIVPKIVIGADPVNDFSLSFELKLNDPAGTDILQLPEKIALAKNKHIVVCIDEFQQVADIGDSKSFQKKLRSVWQLQKHVSYCLYGSKKHLMSELFDSQSLPFYKFGDVLYLQKISKQDWVPFIRERFESSGKTISEKFAGQICDWVENQSFYVQQLSWLVWLRTEGEVGEEELSNGLEDLLDQSILLYQKETEGLSAYQMNFMKALADGVHTGFSTKATIDKYNLGSSANVNKLKKMLLKKELIDLSGSTVAFLDPVYGLWFRKEVLKLSYLQ
ncbi:MAG: ATP-binding protein [Mariniphaga sp.]